MIPLVIVGAGGFGRETVDVVRALNKSAPSPVYDLLGVVDSGPSGTNIDRLHALNVAYLGTEKEWSVRSEKTHYLVGVGNPVVRKQIAERFDEAGHVAAIAVHPSVDIGSYTTISPGTVVCAGVQISTNIRCGRHTHINANATVGHDVVLEDYVSLNPGCIISGEVHCETEVLIGAGAVVLQGLTVGRGSVVGAAACVTRPVTAGSVAKGVPAR